jgi:hypothetical protein
MGEGHNCDGGGHHCDSASASGGGADGGYSLGPDGLPIPNVKVPTINGAPVSDLSQEYVIPSVEPAKKGQSADKGA